MRKLDVTQGRTRRWFAVTTVLLSCCATLPNAAPQTPDRVVRDYARALSDGELQTAYALMSPAYRQRVSFDAWKLNIEANPEEVGEASRRLSRIRSQADLDQLSQAPADHPLRLEEARGQWYLATEPIEFYDQSTPRAALHSFVAAFTRKRYDVLLRLMPDADKEGVTSESLIESFGHAARNDIARLLAQLRPSLNEPIELHGDHATMPYAGHRRVLFVQEHDRWKIVEAR